MKAVRKSDKASLIRIRERLEKLSAVIDSRGDMPCRVSAIDRDTSIVELLDISIEFLDYALQEI